MKKKYDYNLLLTLIFARKYFGALHLVYSDSIIFYKYQAAALRNICSSDSCVVYQGAAHRNIINFKFSPVFLKQK